MKTLSTKLALLVVAVGCVGQAFATGFYGPREYLASGGKNLVASPEFYWELETKRLARNYHPTEKPMIVTRDPNETGVAAQAPMIKATADADDQDFAEALKAGAIKPPDTAKATQQQDDARKFIAAADATTTGPLPAEADSEFADYHRGAYAYRQGKEHWDEAKKAWETLLKRPANERHYRTVWADFMLGKLGMKSGDYAAAVKWFEKTREDAKKGFADSLGMAADSYGWEGRSEWKQNHPEKAAPLYLNQLALGDESAIVSLKALVPDRSPVDGMLNYGPELEDLEKQDTATKQAAEKTAAEGLKAAAADPLLRRLVTAHILATGSSGQEWSRPGESDPRSERWLKVVSATKPGPLEDAEYLGWLAYINGDYKEASRWLELAKPGSPAAEWLRAKLQLRAGKIPDAVQSLGKAIETLRDPALYTGWKAGKDETANESLYVYGSDGESWSMAESASGDLGGLHLERGDAIQALDILLKGELWEDAAFVAERILTADELKAYVDKMPSRTEAKPAKEGTPTTTVEENDGDTDAANNEPAQLRYLLGRRLVREDRYTEAAAYLPSPYDKIVQKYAQALKDGANAKLPKKQRAEAWSTAAWLARYDGMELMGTEVAPDGFVSGGDFPNTDMAQEFVLGKHKENKTVDGQDKNVMVANAMPLPAGELKLMEKNKPSPDVRYHYRVIAAALALKAAALMEDNTEELADLLNTAGTWAKESKEAMGNRCYDAIDKRCGKTTIGAKVLAKHWFVDETGPWSTEQQSAYEAMRATLGIKKSE